MQVRWGEFKIGVLHAMVVVVGIVLARMVERGMRTSGIVPSRGAHVES